MMCGAALPSRWATLCVILVGCCVGSRADDAAGVETASEGGDSDTPPPPPPPKPLAERVCGIHNAGGCEACRAAGCGWCQESNQCVQDMPNRCQDGYPFHIGKAGLSQDCGICAEKSCCRESKMCKQVEKVFDEKVWDEKCDDMLSDLDKGSVPQPLWQLCPCSCKKCPDVAGEGPPICESLYLETLAEQQLRQKPFEPDYKDWGDEEFHQKTTKFIQGKVPRQQENVDRFWAAIEKAGGEDCSEQERDCYNAKLQWLIAMDELEARKFGYQKKIKGIHEVLGLPDPGCIDFLNQCELVKTLNMCEESCAGTPCKSKCRLTCGECEATEGGKDEL